MEIDSVMRVMAGAGIIAATAGCDVVPVPRANPECSYEKRLDVPYRVPDQKEMVAILDNVAIFVNCDRNVSAELGIIGSLFKKIPSVDYLIPGGVVIQKEEVLTRGVITVFSTPAFSKSPDGIKVIVSGDFSPYSTFGGNPLSIYRSHQERLEQAMASEMGKILLGKIRGREKNLVGRDWEVEPFDSTFARVIDWKSDIVKVRVLAEDGLEAEVSELNWRPEIRGIPRWFMPGFIEGNWSIEDVFAQSFAASILHTELLKPEEMRFFDNLDRGLLVNPEEFVEKIRGNPQVLLR